MAKVRISGHTLKVLRFLADAPKQARSGYEIAKACGIGSSTMYPLLSRLEQAHWLDSEWEVLDASNEGRPRRRYYKLTPLGQTEAHSALADHGIPTGALAWT